MADGWRPGHPPATLHNMTVSILSTHRILQPRRIVMIWISRPKQDYCVQLRSAPLRDEGPAAYWVSSAPVSNECLHRKRPTVLPASF